MSELKISFNQYELIPEGNYPARIKEMEATDSPFDGKRQVKIAFELTDHELQSNPDATPRICAFFTLSLHEKSNLSKKVVTPLLGRSPSVEDCKKGRFDLEQFLGTMCEIKIAHVARKSDGSIIAIVEKVLGKLED